MEFDDLIKVRHSCRNYSSEPLEEKTIEAILEAGRVAPSAQNKQCWRYIVVKDAETIRKLAFHSLVGTTNYFIKDAPVVIVACADTNAALRYNSQDYYLVDVGISFHQMMLAGWNLGVGSCWLAGFNEGVLKRMFGLGENIRIVGFSPFGYPKEKGLYAKLVGLVAHSSHRKGLEEIVIAGSGE